MAVQKTNYLLSFVGESIFDPRYHNWAGGRMEIYTDESQYAIDEIRFFTPINKAWIHFIDKYDGEEVDKPTLDKIVNTIETNFQMQ